MVFIGNLLCLTHPMDWIPGKTFLGMYIFDYKGGFPFGSLPIHFSAWNLKSFSFGMIPAKSSLTRIFSNKNLLQQNLSNKTRSLSSDFPRKDKLLRSLPVLYILYLFFYKSSAFRTCFARARHSFPRPVYPWFKNSSDSTRYSCASSSLPPHIRRRSF